MAYEMDYHFPNPLTVGKKWQVGAYQTWWRAVDLTDQAAMNIDAHLVPIIHGAWLSCAILKISGNMNALDLESWAYIQDLGSAGDGSYRIASVFGGLAAPVSGDPGTSKFIVDPTDNGEDWGWTHWRPHITAPSGIAAVADICFSQTPYTYTGPAR